MSSTGVNFAYGGSGLFDTYGPDFINISTQIDQFQQISSEHIIDYANSLVLFVYGGNDYSVHLQKSGRKVTFDFTVTSKCQWNIHLTLILFSGYTFPHYKSGASYIDRINEITHHWVQEVCSNKSGAGRLFAIYNNTQKYG